MTAGKKRSAGSGRKISAILWPLASTRDRAIDGSSAQARLGFRDCVKSHFGELSAPCQDVVTKVAAIGKVCKADVKQFCADVKPGGGRIETCMKSHLSDISDPCKDALATAGKS